MTMNRNNATTNNGANNYDNENYRSQTLSSGLAGLFGGLFGNSNDPYDQAAKQYNKSLNQAKDIQNPFYTAGKNAIPNFTNWAEGMKNPSDFINNLVGQYQQSPYAKYLQQSATRAATNLGSATGLTDSSALQEAAQQNATNIASGDLNKWLEQVLGINTQYGKSQQSLINTGQTSANSLTDLISNYGKSLGGAAYGSAAGNNQDMFNTIAGLGQLLSLFVGA